MIRENQRFFNLLLVAIDIIVILLALIFAWYLSFESNLFGYGYTPWGIFNYAAFIVFVIPIYIIFYYLFGLYSPQRIKKLYSESLKIIQVNITVFFIVTTLLFLFHFTFYPGYTLLMFYLFSIIMAISERLVLRLFLREMRSKGYNIKHILVIGAGTLAVNFSMKLKENPYVGYNIIGFLDDNLEKGYEILDSKVIGNIKDLEYFLLKYQIDNVVITIKKSEDIFEIVNICEKQGVKAEIVPYFSEYIHQKPDIDMIDDIPIINIRYVPLERSFNSILKRIFDLVITLFAIILLSPLMLFIAVMVKISSQGPIIFKQERVGFNRKTFIMYKFRTMKVQNEDSKSLWTTKDDPRITKFGLYIRRTSLDELPQFFNVLKGDMSLIGPRPERPYYVEKFREDIPKYMIKHYVRPGMTGWAQINGYRGDTSIKKRIEYDIHYVENWSIQLDLKIFFLTLTSGLKHPNAY